MRFAFRVGMTFLRRRLACASLPLVASLLGCGVGPGGDPSATDVPREDAGLIADEEGNVSPRTEAGADAFDAGGGVPGDAATALADGASPAAFRLRHPGLLSGMDDLRAIKQHVVDGDAPWAGEIAHLRARVAASTLRTPPPRPIYCGSYNKDPQGNTIPECDYAVDNGIDAYSFALLGYLTDTTSYSEDAVRIVMTWADSFKGFDAAGSNALLQAGWTAPWFANAAEILRHTYAGWTADHTRRATALLRLLLPQVADETAGAYNNWLHSRIEAHIAIAIFLDDPAMLATAIAQWKSNTPSYFYIGADRQVPVPPHRTVAPASLAATWDTPSYVPGMTMETCRDLNHQGLGVRSIFNSLAMARTQGIDALSGSDLRERLTTFLEEQARWMVSKKDPPGACHAPIVLSPGSAPTHMDSATPIPFEIAVTSLSSTAAPLPGARAAILAMPSTSAGRWVTKWETLTHHPAPN
jgi:hypothetical protein